MNNTPKPIHKIALVALVILAPMVMLYPLWSNPVSAGEDDVVFYYPLRKMAGDALRDGRLPLYNPREATGVPLMADPQSAVMYPPTWLFAVINAKLAYSLSIFLAFSLAGAGAYLYLRRLGLRAVAAVFGATAFMFCGFMVGHRVHLAMIHTACYLPWGLWCIEGLRRNDRGAWGVLLWMVPIAFLALTAGHWPTFIQMSIVWAAYLLLRARPLSLAVGAAALALILAFALAAPQIFMTGELLAHATRQRIGYATAGENSFFPAAAVLAVFPMIMGMRTPNFFQQEWWGPWHQCEMLGYVGLLTLVLAGVAIWRMYRKPRSAIDPSTNSLRELVRKWAWIAAGAFVWMLGYYLPTYKLIHALPILGVVRCPARMVVAVDMALATLAGITVHVLVTGQQASTGRLAKTVRRAATITLPLIMLGTLAIVATAGLVIGRFWPHKIEFFVGRAEDMLRSVDLANPAVWVPIALVVASGLAVRYWLRRARRRAPVLIAILIVDLFVLTRFVDVPAAGQVAPDPEISPAAAWLGENAPPAQSYRVWGLSETYHHRPAELLLPKTAQALGFETIASYGPFQSPAHAQVLGLRIFGTCRDWAGLIRRNHLLSLYNVRYILAADPKFRSVIESVRVPAGPPSPDGVNLLTGKWRLFRTEATEGGLQLRTPFLWSPSVASQPVTLRPGDVYRISLDARGPEGGAANFLSAGVLPEESGGHGELGLIVFAEQIGQDWRHFEWTFRAPDNAGETCSFEILTMSERPISLRNVSLRRSSHDQPIGFGGALGHGEKIYRKLAELPARRRGDPPVAIYENLLCRGQSSGHPAPWTNESLERLKWSDEGPAASTADAPDLAIPPVDLPGAKAAALMGSGVGGYVLVSLMALARRRRRKKFA